MQNRWSDLDAKAATERAAFEDLGLLAYATRLLGSDLDLAMHGGGNTSCKRAWSNLFGDIQPALFVKPSGMDLAHVEEADFVALDLTFLRRMLGLADLDDDAMAVAFACHGLRPSSRRASVETLMHAAIPQPVVVHTHPSAILALTNRSDGEAVVRAVLGPEVALVPYAPAGLPLARAVSETLRRQPEARGLVLMHHGLVTWGASAAEAYVGTIGLVDRAETYLAKGRRSQAVAEPGADAVAAYVRLAPIIRGVLGPTAGQGIEGRVVLAALLDGETRAALAMPDAQSLFTSAPLTPDYLVRTRRQGLWLDGLPLEDAAAFKQGLEAAVARYQDTYRAYVEANGGPSLQAPLGPRVLAIPGVGVVCVGADERDAHTVRDITAQALAVKRAIAECGGVYRSLDDRHLVEMEFRAFQTAKLARQPGETPPLHGSIALVTGAAGAIGSGICEALLAAGCHVAVTDLPGPTLEELGRALAGRYPGRAITVGMDVTDPTSVAAGFARATATWGGVDAVIVNAGIAHVAPLVELDLATFRRLEAVNVEGSLLVLAEAGRQLGRQGSGGDIVLVSTKNVFAPGAGFGAYSATKAASHQLARIASLELASVGVRVNMVAPDAVFSHGEKRSGLWAAVGPNRMKARGLDEKGLEEYYRSRNLLKATVTADHVAAAVLFFLTQKTPTTGATIPVDGGLPDATPR